MKRTGIQTYLVKETICNSFLHTLHLPAINVTCKEMQVTPSHAAAGEPARLLHSIAQPALPCGALLL